MKRWGCLILIVIGVGLFAVYLVTRKNEKERYEEAVQKLREAGEPTDPAELAPPPVPESENAEPLIRIMVERLAELEKTHGSFYELQGEPGLEDLLDAAAPLLREIDEALRRPSYRVDADWSLGWRMRFDWLRLTRVASFLEAGARRAMVSPKTQPRCDEFVARILDLAKFSGQFSTLAYLIRLSIEGTAVTVLRDAMKADGFDVSFFRGRLEPRLIAAESSHDLKRALRGERTLMIQFMADPDDEMVDAMTRFGHSNESWDDELSRRWLWRPFRYRDANRYLAIMEEALGLCGDSRPEALEEAAALRQRTLNLPSYYIMSRGMAHGIYRTLLLTRLAAAQLRLARTALALMAYRQAHGSFPESLTAIEAPVDPFTGERFEYVRDEGAVRITAKAPSASDWTTWTLPR